jgi:hypothetical protein
VTRAALDALPRLLVHYLGDIHRAPGHAITWPIGISAVRDLHALGLVRLGRNPIGETIAYPATHLNPRSPHAH